MVRSTATTCASSGSGQYPTKSTRDRAERNPDARNKAPSGTGALMHATNHVERNRAASNSIPMPSAVFARLVTGVVTLCLVTDFP